THNDSQTHTHTQTHTQEHSPPPSTNTHKAEGEIACVQSVCLTLANGGNESLVPFHHLTHTPTTHTHKRTNRMEKMPVCKLCVCLLQMEANNLLFPFINSHTHTHTHTHTHSHTED